MPPGEQHTAPAPSQVESKEQTCPAGASAAASIVDGMWPLPLPECSMSSMQQWSEADIRSRMTGDRLFDNLILNKYEFSTGAPVLRSFPWRLSVPFVLCNARCDFCAAWLVKGEPMPVDLLRAMLPVLERCHEVDLVGWGEPLIHPQFAEILEFIKQAVDPRARIELTTNGVKLLEWADRLLEANVTAFSISISAATAATHSDLMGLDPRCFDKVVKGISHLAKRKRQSYSGIQIRPVFIVMQQNLAEIPRFIRLCEELGVDGIVFRTLMPKNEISQDLDYHRLPPYLHPEFETLRSEAIAAIRGSGVPVQASPETWATPVFPKELEAQAVLLPIRSREERLRTIPRRIASEQTDGLPLGELDETAHCLAPSENPYARQAPIRCPSPYTAFYANGFDRQVSPCCYMGRVPGYQKMYFQSAVSFGTIWNSPAMTGLRRSLSRGPLLEPCLKCPFFW